MHCCFGSSTSSHRKEAIDYLSLTKIVTSRAFCSWQVICSFTTPIFCSIQAWQQSANTSQQAELIFTVNENTLCRFATHQQLAVPAGQHAGQLKDKLASEVEEVQEHAQAAAAARGSVETRLEQLETGLAELRGRQRALQVDLAFCL